MRWFWVLVAVTACGGVEHKRRTFPVEVASLAPGGVNDHGWAATVTSATARIETVRFFTGKVLISRFRFDPYSLIGGTAWAHPGHYLQGEALGELLTGKDIDLLSASPVELGLAEAVTGEYGSVQLGLGAVRVAGTATKAGQTVVFESATFTPAEPLEGIAFDRVVRDEEGRVHLDVKLQTWLSRIDFSTPFTADGEAYNGFVRGVEDTSSYEVTWK